MGKSVLQLEMDIRRVMEPYTATKLKVTVLLFIIFNFLLGFCLKQEGPACGIKYFSVIYTKGQEWPSKIH